MYRQTTYWKERVKKKSINKEKIMTEFIANLFTQHTFGIIVIVGIICAVFTAIVKK